MKEVVKNQLVSIEKENNVKILYAVESGSRGWGFESSDSDYDVRFIYVHPTEWYLNVFEGPDIIELPVDDLKNLFRIRSMTSVILFKNIQNTNNKINIV